MSSSFWFQFGGFSGAAAVALGAFGAHGLRNRVKDPKLLDTWNTAAHYHLLHSAMICLTPLIVHSPQNWSGRLFATGIIVFSGSLYGLVLSEQKKLGAITPIGGALLIAGWVALALRK